MLPKDTRPKLGERLYKIRTDRKLSLQEVADMTGISRSTLYKVERKGVSLTYDKLVELSHGLNIDISELFTDRRDDENRIKVTARRVVMAIDKGEIVETDNYIYHYLCNELAQKLMVPTLLKVKARTIEEFGPLIEHPGEEFSLVLNGKITIYTKYYEPITLSKNEVIYMDSTMPHAYINTGEGDAVVLTVVSSPDANLKQQLESVLHPATRVIGLSHQ